MSNNDRYTFKLLRKNSTNTSLINLNKSLVDEIKSTIPYQLPDESVFIQDDYFIPFLNERDGMGRLISSKSPSSKTKKPILTPLHEKIIITPKTTKKLLLSRARRSSNPAVGSYYKPQSWIKPSFSSKSLLDILNGNGKHSKSISDLESSNNDSILSRKKSLPRKLIFPNLQRESAVERKKSSVKRIPRKKGIWEDLKLHGQADEIKEALVYASDFNFVNSHHRNIRALMNEMKKKLEC
ncbi:unnamed protein product [Blepharisma stoltei]|uniref:Uncharacterized protein n=1 Tax=Blepharisma stoltei TaxID=1481888 RepID=A0AAU9JBU6_9CILI|nr:unnamed protein product [Blepharisma stoltei]